MKSKTKIAVIGVGFVGSTSAYTLMMSSLDLEIVLVDVNRKKASGDALDIMHGAPFLPPSEIYPKFPSNYSVLGGSTLKAAKIFSCFSVISL